MAAGKTRGTSERWRVNGIDDDDWNEKQLGVNEREGTIRAVEGK